MVRKKIENYLSKAEILKEKSRRGNGSESDGQIMSPNLSSPKEKLQVIHTNLYQVKIRNKCFFF